MSAGRKKASGLKPGDMVKVGGGVPPVKKAKPAAKKPAAKKAPAKKVSPKVVEKAEPPQLTDRQRMFVAEYLVDLNATQAAIRAGYSAKTAEQQGPRLLGNVGVSAAIEAAMKAREQRTQITADRVLQELGRLAFSDIRKLYNEDGSMKLPHELDDDAAAALSGIDVTEEFTGKGDERELAGFTKKAKVFDKGAALTLAMRHLGMLKDKVAVGGADDMPPIRNEVTGQLTISPSEAYMRMLGKR